MSSIVSINDVILSYGSIGKAQHGVPKLSKSQYKIIENGLELDITNNKEFTDIFEYISKVALLYLKYGLKLLVEKNEIKIVNAKICSSEVIESQGLMTAIFTIDDSLKFISFENYYTKDIKKELIRSLNPHNVKLLEEPIEENNLIIYLNSHKTKFIGYSDEKFKYIAISLDIIE